MLLTDSVPAGQQGGRQPPAWLGAFTWSMSIKFKPALQLTGADTEWNCSTPEAEGEAQIFHCTAGAEEGSALWSAGPSFPFPC